MFADFMWTHQAIDEIYFTISGSRDDLVRLSSASQICYMGSWLPKVRLAPTPFIDKSLFFSGISSFVVSRSVTAGMFYIET
jgi:hypothetical protein